MQNIIVSTKQLHESTKLPQVLLVAIIAGVKFNPENTPLIIIASELLQICRGLTSCSGQSWSRKIYFVAALCDTRKLVFPSLNCHFGHTS